MKAKGKELEFISYIKRDGTGTIMCGGEWNKEMEHPKTDDMSYVDDEITDEDTDGYKESIAILDELRNLIN